MSTPPEAIATQVLDGVKRPEGLTDKEWVFAQEFLVDLNGTQAAIRAGYSRESAASIASENLRKPKIARTVADLVQSRTGVTRTRVLEEVAHLAFSDIRKIVSWRPEQVEQFAEDDEGGEPTRVILSRVTVKDSAELEPGAAAAVASVTQGSQGQLTVRMHDKSAALDKLMRVLGMLKDVGPVNVELRPTIILSGRPEPSSSS